MDSDSVGVCASSFCTAPFGFALCHYYDCVPGVFVIFVTRMENQDLQFSQGSGVWPVSASREGAQFVFTGDFSAGRVTAEKAMYAASRTVDFIVYGVCVVGLVALAYGVMSLGLEEQDPFFMFRPHWYNLFTWVGVLAGLFVWAKRLHEAAEYEVTRVLSWANVAQWSKSGATVDVFRLFTRGAHDVWNLVPGLMAQHGGGQANTLHIFAALLTSDPIKMVFYRFGVNPVQLQKHAEEMFGSTVLDAQTEAAFVGKLPFLALQEALKLRNRSVDPLMLLCALVEELPDEHPIQKVFFNLDLGKEKLEVIAAWVFNLDLLIEQDRIFRKLARHKSDSGVNKGLTAVPTPYLDQFSVDLTIQAKYHRLPLTRGRDEDTDKIVELLATSGKSVLVKGAVGTGRSTVLADLAYRMAVEQVPSALEDKRLIRLELAGILGSKVSAEQALLNIFKEAEHSNNIIFALDDVQQLAKATGGEGLSVLELLVNHLENSSIQVIATTTPEDYQTKLRDSANFDERFVTYELADLNSAGVMLAASMRASQLEAQTGGFFQYQAVEEAVRLTDQFFRDVGQPQKAIQILQEAANRVKGLPKGPQKLITPKLIQEVMAEKTHVPTSSFSQDEAEKLLHLEEQIGRRLIGQQEAVTAVSEGMRRARSGLSSGERPMASFLFVGPTGVGKTELAKTLAGVYFGDEKYLLRLDMSEYRGDDGMRKMVGMPGDTHSTPFVEHLKTYPFCLFLLDELEKASPDVLNLFLQVLEDGRITTAGGQTLDLTHTIIIGTSNAGTPEIQAGIREGRTTDAIKSELLDKILINYYRPEFLNRFDGVILFKPLVPEEVVQITRLQLASVTKNLFEKKIKLGFTDAAIQKVATEAFDPLLGGRPIRRYIQDHVESVIARLLLSKQLDRGGDVTIDVNEAGEFISK